METASATFASLMANMTEDCAAEAATWQSCVKATCPDSNICAQLINSQPLDDGTTLSCALQGLNYCKFAASLATCCPGCSASSTERVLGCALTVYPSLTEKCPSLADCNSGSTNPGAGSGGIANMSGRSINLILGAAIALMFRG